MTICNDCAINKGLIPKTDIRSVWIAECPYCKLLAEVGDEGHDWKRPGERAPTLDELFLYQAIRS